MFITVEGDREFIVDTQDGFGVSLRQAASTDLLTRGFGKVIQDLDIVKTLSELASRLEVDVVEHQQDTGAIRGHKCFLLNIKTEF